MASTETSEIAEQKSAPEKPSGKRSAFSELMSPKRKVPTVYPSKSHIHAPPIPNDRRSGLLAYIKDPTLHPTQVISHSADFVLIRDLYPKATVHLLLLPRNPSKYLLHPHEAFTDPEFLSKCRTAVTSAAQLAAKELQRLLGQFSTTDAPRLAALEKGDETIPQGRDWSKEIRIGAHAHPSMTHLHIHIISRDMHSECLRHRKHYNSFNTDFFIPLEDYPLREEDERRSTKHQNANLKDVSFKCWRCGRNFGNRFKELKGHLEEEFGAWRKE
jgi:aprataxin